MKRRRKHPQHQNHERWLVSYADFITLMFAFFVVMFSSAQVDKRKVGQLAQQMQIAFQELGVFPAHGSTMVPGGEALMNDPVQDTPALVAARNGSSERAVAEIKEELEVSLKQQIANNSVSVRSRGDGLVISLREAGFFESGSATPKPESLPALQSIAGTLASRGNAVRIEGHTDNVPIHTGRFASNWELSTTRATEIVRFFLVNQKFAPNRIAAAGFAEFHPVAANDTPEGRALNRRVDIVVLRD